jgi:predicted AAA+ superfamily ATPase
MDRHYHRVLVSSLVEHRQMVFVSGARQVGKTTLAKQIGENFSVAIYLNWDDIEHRQIILGDLVEILGLNQLNTGLPLLILDELHKFADWKSFLKGLFDRFEGRLAILVTGSARMDVFRKGGDSLMGRYFNYRLHPLSVAELVDSDWNTDQLIQAPKALAAESFDLLFKFGGFPEVFVKADSKFYKRWRRLRQQQLIREDIRDATRVQEIAQLEMLVVLLEQQAGQITKYSTLAKQLRVSVDTVRRWLDILEGFYYCYRIRPWYQNISTALRKEPKTYLWDWSNISEPGAKVENFIASHLLKAVHAWTDIGLGEFNLHYLRTKDQKEVDFLVSKDQKAWLLVEVKNSMKAKLNPNLAWFQAKTEAKYAFQVAMDAEFVEADCFQHTIPIKVPARTFLSQLL